MGNRRGRRGSDRRRRDTAPADNAPDDTAPAGNLTKLSSMGRDERGWPIVKLQGRRDAAAPLLLVNLKVCGKPLQLVQQEADLIVYVNPEIRGYDDWESPPGSGNIFQCCTPEGMLQEYAFLVARAAGAGA